MYTGTVLAVLPGVAERILAGIGVCSCIVVFPRVELNDVADGTQGRKYLELVTRAFLVFSAGFYVMSVMWICIRLRPVPESGMIHEQISLSYYT